MQKRALCKTCGSTTHYTTFCWQTKKKTIRKVGKVGEQWITTRRKWANQDAGGKMWADNYVWHCHYCGVPLVLHEQHPMFEAGAAQILTLDHIKPRSTHPDLRFELSNIIPACGFDNRRKGSMSYDSYIEKYYPDKAWWSGGGEEPAVRVES